MSSKSKSKSGVKAVPVENVDMPETSLNATQTAEVPAVIEAKIFRDKQGRLTLSQAGRPDRIAGSDDVFIEVARQFARDILIENQI